MGIPFEWLAEKLKILIEIRDYHSSSGNLTLNSFAFYTGEAILLSDTLYICNAKDLPEKQKASPTCAWLLVGELPAQTLSVSYIHAANDSDVFRLGNEVHRLFDLFQTWELRLKDPEAFTSLNETVKELLEATDPILDNGITVMDNSFAFLATSETNIRYGGYDKISELYDYQRSAPDVMANLRDDPEFQEASGKKEIYYLSDRVLPYRTMCKNLFLDGRFILRIAVTECIRPFRKSDELILALLSEAILTLYQKFTPAEPVYNSALSRIFYNAISNISLNKYALDAELRSLEWKPDDSYCVSCLRPFAPLKQADMFSYYCTELMKEIPDSFAFQAGQNIAVVKNLSKSGSSLYEASIPLRLFVRDNNFRTGISNAFSDLYNVRRYYRQAEIALDIGSEESPTEWLHQFSDYVLPYITGAATGEFSSSELLSPVYYRLKEYDDKNDTEFVKTLDVYLRNNQNAVRSAKELFIHRSTFLYRLNRICEIGKTELKSPEELLHLSLTFYLLSH